MYAIISPIIDRHLRRSDTVRMHCCVTERAVDGNLLFQNLSLPAKLAIFTSMSPLQVSRGALIIKQVGARLAMATDIKAATIQTT